jgi:hypothetical protein
MVNGFPLLCMRFSVMLEKVANGVLHRTFIQHLFQDMSLENFVIKIYTESSSVKVSECHLALFI